LWDSILTPRREEEEEERDRKKSLALAARFHHDRGIIPLFFSFSLWPPILD
jgi:late competence protein required for DNA uptake (superfamily II DNA/RNA helicase)